MPFRSLIASGLFALCLVPSGCGPAKLNVTKPFETDPAGNVPAIHMDPQPQAQKITVKVTAPEEVDLFVIAPEKLDKFGDLSTDKRVKEAMASKTGVKNDSLVVDVPAKTAYTVVIGSKKKTKGEVTITNQK